MKMKKKLFLLIFAIAIVLSAFCLAVCADTSEPEVNTYAYNLVFGNQVYIEYAVKVDGATVASLSDVGVLIWREGTTDRTPETAVADIKAARTASVEGVNCYVSVYTDLSAKEMTDKVFSQPYVKYNGKTYYGKIVEYSICTYAERKLGLVEGVQGTKDENLRSMIREMLHYGANAQKYFGYKTETLATGILEGRVNVTYENMEEISNPNPATLEYASGKYILQKPERDGYTFKGWKDIDNEWTDITEIDTSSAKTYNLSAVWELNKYSITYKDPMGVSNGNNETYTVRDLVNPRALEKYDYTFNGWRIGSAYGEFVSEETLPVGTTGNLVLYADWTQKPEFEGYDYIVLDNYFQPNGQPTCILTGISEEMSQSSRLEIPDIFNQVQLGVLKDCSNLTELTLPYLGSDYTGSSGAYLGYWFGAPSGATQEKYIPSGLKKVSVLGNGVIGDYAFANCSSLEEIYVSGSVTSIGRNAYLNCASLVTLTTPVFPELESKVSDGAERLNDTWDQFPTFSVYDTDYYYGLPGSYYYRGEIYNDKYPATPDIPVSDKFQTLCINGGVIAANAFFKNLGIKKVIIENVEVVGRKSFAYCTNLTELVLGDGVKDVRNLAFCGTAIREVVIPDSVTRLGYDEATSGYARLWDDGVFSNLLNLEKVVIGNGVETIPAAMFYNCTLANETLEITLGKKVRSISPCAFVNLNYEKYYDYVKSSGAFVITNRSECKEMIMFADDPSSSSSYFYFFEALMNSNNAPEKVYFAGTRFYDPNSALSRFLNDCGRSEEEALALAVRWNVFFYADSDPYQGENPETRVGFWHYGEKDYYWFYDNYNNDGRVAKSCPTVVEWKKRAPELTL